MHCTGTTFLSSVLIAPVKNENNDVILFILNLEDITDAPVKTDVQRQTSKKPGSASNALVTINQSINHVYLSTQTQYNKINSKKQNCVNWTIRLNSTYNCPEMNAIPENMTFKSI